MLQFIIKIRTNRRKRVQLILNSVNEKAKQESQKIKNAKKYMIL